MEETTDMMTDVMANQETQNFIFRAFEEGGTAMYFIATVGILTLVVIIKQIMALKDASIDKKDFNENLFGMVLRGDIQQAINYCDSRPSPLTNTLKAGLVQVMNKRPDEEIQVAMDAAVLRDTPKVEGWVSFLAVFGNLSTLIGLIGTIIGMITAFRGVSDADDAKKSGFAFKRDFRSTQLYSFWAYCCRCRYCLFWIFSTSYQSYFERNDRKQYEPH